MARHVEVTAPGGLMQVISLRWNKSARGGQGARNRNAVPLAFAVPPDHLRDLSGQLQVEELYWGGINAFSEPYRSQHQRVPVEAGFRFGCVSVTGCPDGLRVSFQCGDGLHAGAPNRWFLNAADTAESSDPARVVQAGQWVRVRSNGRFTDSDGFWYYEQVTVNVAWFDGEASGQVFVDGEPFRELQFLADLR